MEVVLDEVVLEVSSLELLEVVSDEEDERDAVGCRFGASGSGFLGGRRSSHERRSARSSSSKSPSPRRGPAARCGRNRKRMLQQGTPGKARGRRAGGGTRTRRARRALLSPERKVLGFLHSYDQ